MYSLLHVILLNPPLNCGLKQKVVGANVLTYHGFSPCDFDGGMISRATHGEPFRYTWQETRDG